MGLTQPWVFIPLLGPHLLPPPLLRLKPRLILRLRLPLMPGTHTTDVLHIMVMDTASGAIMGVMLATMVAMQAMAMVAITVLDTDTMVESDAAMGTVPLCLALLENRKIRNIYIFFVKSQK